MLPKKIYDAVFEYCQKEGFIDKLKHWLSVSDTELVRNKKISNAGLDTIDAIHCLFDKGRSFAFLRELDLLVKKGDIVYEAGIGTGLLSFLAAAKGAEVYGTEISLETYDLAEKIRKHLEKTSVIPKNTVHFIRANAINFKLEKEADIVISENIYTGMFRERQVQIINNSISFLKKDGKVVPASMNSYLCLTDAQFLRIPKNREEVVPSPDKNIKIKSLRLSKIFRYDTIDFTKKISSLKKEVSLLIPTTKEGSVNSILIYSEIKFLSGAKIGRFDTSFLNGDIFIAHNPPLMIEKGDIINVDMLYRYGSDPKNISLDLTVYQKSHAAAIL